MQVMCSMTDFPIEKKMTEPSRKMSIPEFFKDRSVFITGASGLMGKVLAEKLLYSCSDIKNIFMLVRPKRGKSATSRMQEMLTLPMFERLRQEKPHLLDKMVPVVGDITLDNLGLSPEIIKRIAEEVTVLYHGAATLKLEADLKDAVELNTWGTWRVIQLAKQMKNLQCFIHISTAFCHVDKIILEEKAYEAPYDPKDIMNFVKWIDNKQLDKITKDLIAPHPNTYTFSKRLAERLVADQYPNLPVCIARPSIVVPAYKEPCAGWVDNLNGPVGIMVAAGKGVLRSMYAKSEYNAELIPVDYAINGLIGIAKRIVMEEKPQDIPVFNLTQAKERAITWGELLEKGRSLTFSHPFDTILWFPGGNIRSSLIVHKICAFFLHWLPAYFIDFLFFLFRQKRFMVRVQNRIALGLEYLQYFTTHQWCFRNEKFLELRDSMLPQDKENFPIDFKKIETLPYITDSLVGARVYCLKEPLENMPRAKRMIRVYYVIDRFVQFLFYMFIAHFIISCSESIRYVFDAAGENMANMPFIRTFVSRDTAQNTGN